MVTFHLGYMCLLYDHLFESVHQSREDVCSVCIYICIDSRGEIPFEP